VYENEKKCSTSADASRALDFPLKASMKVMRRHFGLDKIERFNPPGFQGYDSVLVLQRARDPQK